MNLIFLMASAGFLSAAPIPDSVLLLRESLRYEITEHVMAQETDLLELCSAEDADEIRRALSAGQQKEITQVRHQLQLRFGEAARETFGDFMTAFAAAEAENQPEFRLSFELPFPPSDYAGLRQQFVATHLSDTLSEASELLSELQTWGVLRTQREDVPSLEEWLAREESPEPPPAPTPKPQPVNPLREAEAGSDWVPPPAGTHPMDGFAERRQQRRATALAEAHAGMEQIASERESAERDAAARKLAAAQADAEAMRAQAQRLAATEQEALAQRENSLGNRLKRIVGSTVSAATGALNGGIGAEAGRRAAEEIFR